MRMIRQLSSALIKRPIFPLVKIKKEGSITRPFSLCPPLFTHSHSKTRRNESGLSTYGTHVIDIHYRSFCRNTAWRECVSMNKKAVDALSQTLHRMHCVSSVCSSSRHFAAQSGAIAKSLNHNAPLLSQLPRSWKSMPVGQQHPVYKYTIPDSREGKEHLLLVF